MQSVKQLLQAKGLESTSKPIDYETFLQTLVESENNKEGDLEGADCRLCKNKGYILKVEEAVIGVSERSYECQCMVGRKNLAMINNSGLKELLETCTFENYKTPDKWQSYIKSQAQAYAKQPEGWFYIGGQVGAGKTHICTAICGQLIERNLPTRYMAWRDDASDIKFNLMDGYNEKLEKFKKIKVLYIDDLFKTGRGDKPTPIEIQIAFEILNYRYNNKDLITIISSEKIIEELEDIDEAVGSRIYARSKEYAINISKDKTKNQRTKEKYEQ